METFLFNSWDSLLRTLVVGVLAYVALVCLLRVSGNRTLSKMNAFDLVVTVALGSTLSAVLLDKSVALADGVVAFGVLIGLQFVVTWTSVRARWVRQLVTGEPQLLLYRGDFLADALQGTRVARDEVWAAIRAAGASKLDEVEAVVLETDGSFSVVRGAAGGSQSSLEGVRRAGS